MRFRLHSRAIRILIAAVCLAALAAPDFAAQIQQQQQQQLPPLPPPPTKEQEQRRREAPTPDQQETPVINPHINPGSMNPVPPTQQTPLPGSLPTFEFRSGFWINLHHFLYEQALLRKDPSRVVMGSATNPSRGVFVIAHDSLTPAEQRDWDTALDYYQQTLAGKDLLQNFDMVAINDVLASLGACTEITGTRDPQCASGLRKEMIVALTLAAPVYREHWWPADDHANRVWIDQVSNLVEKWGVRVAQQLALAYQTPWPRGRLAVDVVGYGGPLGAYTTPDPLHLTISSRDPRNLGGGGLAAFEVLFYEASHGVANSLERAIAVRCRDAGKPIPRDLWHAALLYTTESIVQREVGGSIGDKVPVPDSFYRPYDQQYALFARGWSNYFSALQSYWQPYLEGRVGFLAAVQNMVDAM